MRLQTSLSPDMLSPTRPSLKIGSIAREERPALFIVGAFIVVMLIGVTRGQIGYNGDDLNAPFGVLLGLWALGYLAQCLSARRLPELCKLIAVFFFLAFTASLSSAVLARADFPLADTSLARADEWLFPGFSWPEMAFGFGHHPQLMMMLSYAYVSLGWQPLLLIAVLCVLGQARFGWIFMSCWAGSLLISMAIFPFVPALGGYVHFGIPHQAMPSVLCGSAWHYPVLLQHLRDGKTAMLNMETLEGIVAMPSFHAASAVLLAWGYGRIAYARWPFFLLNFTMWVSAVPIGGHYLVDVLAGTMIALGTIIVVSLIERGAGPSLSRESGI